MPKIRKTLANLKFRMNLRNTLKKESYDLLVITKEEVIKELNIRSKGKWQKNKQPN